MVNIKIKRITQIDNINNGYWITEGITNDAIWSCVDQWRLKDYNGNSRNCILYKIKNQHPYMSYQLYKW